MTRIEAINAMLDGKAILKRINEVDHIIFYYEPDSRFMCGFGRSISRLPITVQLDDKDGYELYESVQVAATYSDMLTKLEELINLIKKECGPKS